MMINQEVVDRSTIFHAIRVSVQELHSDKVFMEDLHGSPFLFKSQDAKVWVRIFYRAMQDFSLEELQQEIKKLWVLMPVDAVLYLFYPSLDRKQILDMNGFSDRLSFFEFANLSNSESFQFGIRICKWIPAMTLASLPAENSKNKLQPSMSKSSFLQKTRLNAKEIEGLSELSLVLMRL
ncbi:MAG TPA: hypothetical protein PLO78_08370 [Candidatus Omnitrophota bacterium]|nr:hypothetical protein [Candidatus Omnitrophota bacterium]